MPVKILLLISAQAIDEAFATAVARQTGLDFQVADSPQEGAAVIAEGNVGVVFVDTSSKAQYQAFEDAIQETIGLYSDKISVNAIHFISPDNLEDVPFLVQSPLFGHFLTRAYGDPTEAGELYARVIRATLSKRAFGLAGLLAAGAQIQTIKLQISTQKQEAVEAVREFLMQAKFKGRMANIVANAVDELLMNSIYDAPIDALGKPIFKQTSRTTPIPLEGQHEVEMQVGFDGTYVGVTSVDLFGSLDKGSLVSHISKIYRQEEYKVRAAIASAGIGLASVYHSGGSLFFVSESRTRTEVTVMFKRTENFLEFKSQFRFISTQFYF